MATGGQATGTLRRALTRQYSLSGRDEWAALADFSPVAPIERPAGRSFVLLDGLRGVAAIVVATYHIAWPSLKLPSAYLAVDFFLQLSGFIVAYAYAQRITSGMPVSDFARARIGRLYPAYLLGILLGVATVLIALNIGIQSGGMLWTPELLLCGLIPQALMIPPAWCSWGYIYPLNAPLWTIFFEVVFSFVFFAFARFLLSWRRAVVAAILMLGVLSFLGVATLSIGPQKGEYLEAFARLGFSFFVGVAVYGIGVRARRTSNAIAVLLPLLLAGVLMVPVEGLGYELLLIVVVFPAIIVVGASYNPSNHRVAWTMLQMGALSYLLYTIHMPIYLMVNHTLYALNPEWRLNDNLWASLTLVAALVLLAWVLSHTYEPAARAIFNRATTTKRPLPHRSAGGGVRVGAAAQSAGVGGISGT